MTRIGKYYVGRGHRRSLLLVALLLRGSSSSSGGAAGAAASFVASPPSSTPTTAASSRFRSLLSQPQPAEERRRRHEGTMRQEWQHHDGRRTRDGFSKSSSRLQMSSPWFEQLLYDAGSAANGLASAGLKDPGNFATSIPIMYGAGLLTSVSPCVWGLLPLTVSYISAAAGERRDGKVLLPTLAFAAGLASVFCTLGVAVAELGGVFGGTGSASGAGVLLPIVSHLICVLMGLQLLDLVELPLPSLDFLNPRKSKPSFDGSSSSEPELILFDDDGKITDTVTADAYDESGRKREEDGSLFRTFLLGGSSALVASPCATPVLASILGFVAASENPAIGATLLLGYTLGYSTPLLIVASTGGQALVRLRQQSSSGGSGDAAVAAVDGEGGGSSSSAGGSFYGKIGPWVTPLTAGILLWYGTDGMLTAVFGDPSLAGLAPVIE